MRAFLISLSLLALTGSAAAQQYQAEILPVGGPHGYQYHDAPFRCYCPPPAPIQVPEFLTWEGRLYRISLTVSPGQRLLLWNGRWYPVWPVTYYRVAAY